MTQLVYQPAFDPYNAAFRLLRLREGLSNVRLISFEMVRILDYFILFPFSIASVKLKQGDKKFRRISKSFTEKEPYSRMPDGSQLLERMKPFQLAATSRLVDCGFLSEGEWVKDIFAGTELELPSKLQESVDRANLEEASLIQMLNTFAEKYSAKGQDGLKARSGLLEYRYDTV